MKDEVSIPMRKLCALALFAATAFSQAPARRNSLDKSALEAYLRRLELLIPAVAIQIENPKRAAFLKEYSEVTVHFSYNGQTKDEHYMVSSDGATLIKGEAFDLPKAFSKAADRRNPLDKPALEAYLRRLESLIPAVTVQIDDPKPAAFLEGYSELTAHFSYNGQVKDEPYMVSSDGATLIRGEAFDLKRSPFQANLDKIKTDGEPSFGGPADAPVTLVIYADFECPYCKAEAPVLRQNVVQAYGNKVQVVFRDFPIAEPHPWARAAHIAGRCVYHQDQEKFWNFFDWIFSVQPEVTVENFPGRVSQWAADNGLKAADFSTCVGTKATEPEVDKSIQEGRSLGVGSTPTSFLNGSKLEGTVEWEVLRQLINTELNRLGVPIPSAARVGDKN
jgi:protein-disulfide isomerase